MKVFPARLDRGRVLLAASKVGMDELDEAVQIFGRYLSWRETH